MVEEKKITEKALLTVEEVQNYLGLGETTVRQMLRNKRKYGFGLRIGNRLYANKKQLDQWLDEQCR
jgi:excisionase family DNA binding protein